MSITNPQFQMSPNDFRQLCTADSGGSVSVDDPEQIRSIIVSAIGLDSLTVESAREAILSCNAANKLTEGDPVLYEIALMANILNLNLTAVYGLESLDRYALRAKLIQSRPHPSPIRPLLTYTILRGALLGSRLREKSSFGMRILLSDVGVVSELIEIFYPDPALCSSDYLEIAEEVCADFRLNAFASALSIVRSLISPTLNTLVCQILQDLERCLAHPAQLLKETPAEVLSDFEQKLQTTSLSSESLHKIKTVIAGVRVCFVSRKLERSQTITNNINSMPLLAALAVEWNATERRMASKLHAAYQSINKSRIKSGRTQSTLISVGLIIILMTLMGLSRLMLEPYRSTSLGMAHALLCGVIWSSCAACVLAYAKLRDIGERFYKIGIFKTASGIRQMNIQHLLKRDFQPYALTRLTQLEVLYRKYQVTYNSEIFSLLRKWMERDIANP